MSFRLILNKYPWIGALALGCGIVLLLWQTVFSGSGAPDMPSKGFYTTDDGKTWFVDNLYRATPFDHEGKEAVGAVVLKCKTGEPFVGYLTRLTPEVAKQVRELEAKKDSNFALQFISLQRGGTEIKRPGEKNWHDPGSSAGARVYSDATKCPDGTQPDTVNP